MALTLDMGIRIRAPREFVFQHLLTPHHLARWFCNFAQFDPRGPAVGSKFRFGGDYAIASAEPPGWPCEIAGGEVLRAVSFTWPLFAADTRVEWRAGGGAPRPGPPAPPPPPPPPGGPTRGVPPPRPPPPREPQAGTGGRPGHPPPRPPPPPRGA